ncbi:MAG: PLP-dependent aminotransferase family protein [Pseudomonadales bacterium]|jgi:2-aminoadipate transaminase
MAIYDFAVGQTNPDTFPVEAFKEAAIRAIENENVAFNKYPGNKGHEGLRKAMAERESEREGVYVDPEQVAIMNGSMQAVTLVGQALMENKGDLVIAEEYTYSGTIGAYKGIGLEFVGIPLDDHGMRMDALSDKLKELSDQDRLPKFIYTLTTYQNPTGTCMPKDRKLELISIAAEYDMPVVEDNCYGDVHFDGDKVPSMYAMDDSPNQIYIGSLSKILAPGVRLGYLIAKEPMYSNIVNKRFDAGSNYFAAAVVAEFYKNGIWDHCNVANPVLKNKRDLLVAALKEHLSDTCVWSHPVGGLFMWVRLPADIDMKKLGEASREKGFYFAPGQAFHVDAANETYIRLAFGHVPDDLITEGIPVLAMAIKEARTSNEARSFDSLFD